MTRTEKANGVVLDISNLGQRLSSMQSCLCKERAMVNDFITKAIAIISTMSHCSDEPTLDISQGIIDHNRLPCDQNRCKKCNSSHPDKYLEYYWDSSNLRHYLHKIHCSNCGAETEWYQTEEKATEAWNEDELVRINEK